MRKHDNTDAFTNIQNETILQRVDYDSFDDKTPFRSPKSSQAFSSLLHQPIQLDIDIEVNESIQLLLNSPYSLDTDLIDVTLIRGTPSFPETTVSLGKPEVKRFLEMVSRKPDTHHNNTNYAKVVRSRTEHRKSIHRPCKLHTTDEECGRFDCTSNRCQNDNFTDSIYTDSTEKPSNNDSNHHPYKRNEKVYASPDMFSKLKSSLACQHSKKYSIDNQKHGTPCLCQHCGMIGVLIESQKRPFIPHNTPPEATHNRSRSEHRKQRRTRTPDASNHEYPPRFRQENYNTTEILPQDTLFEDLLYKLKSLEARVLAQEEKAVGKEYFQYVIRKMLSQYVSKMVQSEMPNNVKSAATQYSRIFLGNPELIQQVNKQHRRRHRSRSSGRNSTDLYIRGSSLDRNIKADRKYKDDDSARSSKADTEYIRHGKNKSVRYCDEDSTSCKRKHWKDIHTEEDLKNRILSLIEGEIGYKKKKESNIHFDVEESTANNEIKVESFKNTICLPHVIHSGRVLVEPQETKQSKDRTITSSTLKDLLDNMSSQIYEDLVKNKSSRSDSPAFRAEQPKYNNVQKALDDTLFKRNIEASKKREMQSVRNAKKDDEKEINMNIKSGPSNVTRVRNPRENLDIQYVNPKANISGESSNSEYTKPKRHQNVDASENRIKQKDSLAYKIDYLRGLAQSKNINEDDLWRSIWRQTKNRFKSKNDILTISIPSRKHLKRPIELELTWSDLKEIMRSTRPKSPHHLSSFDLLLNQKKNRECNINQNEYTTKTHSYKKRSKSLR